MEDAGYCTVCKKFYLRECPHCGQTLMDPTPMRSFSAPIDALAGRIPNRTESPTLTPNMMPAFPARFRYEEEEEEEAMDVAMAASFAEEQSPEPDPADPALFDGMDRGAFGDKGEEGGSCPVCLQDFARGEDIIWTSCCRVMVHTECMESTLCVIPCCPFCRWRPHKR